MPGMLKKLIGGIALAAAMAGAAQATPLSGLLNGGSITAGDKLFDNWRAVYRASDGRSFNASNIEVSALAAGGLDPGPGLRFSAQSGELTVAGNGSSAFIDLTFGFRVSVLDPALMVTGSTLEYVSGGAFHSIFLDGSWDAGSAIDATIGTAAGLSDLDSQNIEFSTRADSSTGESRISTISDVASFAPRRDIWVTKNVRVWARDVGDSAGAFGFEQRFSQTAIPEPTSLALAGVALLGLIGARRRQRR